MEQKQNSISFEDLIQLQDDSCVQVSKSYFQSLLVMAKYTKDIDKTIFEIFRKYIDIENMFSYIYGKEVNMEYYLMSAYDIKTLINSINFEQYSSTTFLKSNVKTIDLHQKHTKIKELYENKKNENNNPTLK